MREREREREREIERGGEKKWGNGGIRTPLALCIAEKQRNINILKLVIS